MLLAIIFMLCSAWLYVSLGTNIMYCIIVCGSSTNVHTTMIEPLKGLLLQATLHLYEMGIGNRKYKFSVS